MRKSEVMRTLSEEGDRMKRVRQLTTNAVVLDVDCKIWVRLSLSYNLLVRWYPYRMNENIMECRDVRDNFIMRWNGKPLPFDLLPHQNNRLDEIIVTEPTLAWLATKMPKIRERVSTWMDNIDIDVIHWISARNEYLVTKSKREIQVPKHNFIQSFNTDVSWDMLNNGFYEEQKPSDSADFDKFGDYIRYITEWGLSRYNKRYQY